MGMAKTDGSFASLGDVLFMNLAESFQLDVDIARKIAEMGEFSWGIKLAAYSRGC